MIGYGPRMVIAGFREANIGGQNVIGGAQTIS